MLTRILTLLDETESSRAAREYAFHLGQITGAHITGMAGVDLTHIEAAMPGRVGASAYKARLEETLKTQARQRCARLRETFEAECSSRGLKFDWLAFEGDPFESLYGVLEARDLLITGHDTAFRGTAHEGLPDMLNRLLVTTPRPVVVCPDRLSATEGILIAYDGSMPAMRSVQMFALLARGSGQPTRVMCIDASREVAERRASSVADYLQSHGYQTDVCPIVSKKDPADVLASEITKYKIRTLVMGAYGHRGLREFLFGSTTSDLVKRPPCALFLYH